MIPPSSQSFRPRGDMPTSRFLISVVVKRFVLARNPWASEQWRPVLAEVSCRDALGVECIEESSTGSSWRFDGLSLELHASESEGYYLNVTSEQPKLFVMWRLEADRTPPVHVVQLTVSYNEAGRFLDGGEQVEAVPMNDEIRTWTEAFVAQNYKPEPRRKSRRNELYEDADKRAARAGTNGRDSS